MKSTLSVALLSLITGTTLMVISIPHSAQALIGENTSQAVHEDCAGNSGDYRSPKCLAR